MGTRRTTDPCDVTMFHHVSTATLAPYLESEREPYGDENGNVEICSTRGRTSGVIVDNGLSIMVSAVILTYSFNVNVPAHVSPPFPFSFFLMNWPVRILVIL